MTGRGPGAMLPATLSEGRKTWMNADIPTAETLLVLCTCPDDASASAVATGLLEERLAACVNRISGVKSSFWWNGHIDKDEEVLLLIKTRAGLFGELETTIKRLHPYDTPEIIGLPVMVGSADYLDWVGSETKCV